MTEIVDPSSPEWYAALTLGERAALYRPRTGELIPRDDRVGEWRSQQWRQQAPFTDEVKLAVRLASIGLTIEDFTKLIGVPNATLRDWHASTPAWLTRLADILNRAADESVSEVPSGHIFADILSPFTSDADTRLERAIAALSREVDAVPVDPSYCAHLFAAPLLQALTTTISRIVALEVHVARLQGLLKGDTPTERLASYARRLRKPDHMVELLKEYAPAARMLIRQMDQWLGAATELIRRISLDRELIETTFLEGAALGVLTAVTTSGDAHGAGRAVSILEFSSGLRLVYKPRSLGVDVGLFACLDWLNRHGASPPFRALRIIDRQAYGWAEFADRESCANDSEVNSYYQRLGGLLAVLYVLDGQDMHMENVIAAGDQPILVDLESMFHPPGDLWIPSREMNEDGAGSARSNDTDPLWFIPRSVMKVGLLPERIWADEDGVGIDLSAIGGAGEQVVPGSAVQLSNVGTDEMRIERVRASVGASNNQPQLAAGDVERSRYADAIDQGFTAAYDLIAAHAQEIANGGLAMFADSPARVIVRPTKIYALLLRESLHPDLLRDALDRDRFFDKLWLATEVRTRVGEVVPLEHEALHRGDIPLFRHTPGSRDLRCDESHVLVDFLEKSALDRVSERLRALDPLDRARQRWLTRAALATLADPAAMPLTPAVGASISPLPDEAVRNVRATPDVGSDSASLIDLAEAIGDRLLALALNGRRLSSWLSLTMQSAQHAASGLARYDLFGGVPGILLFLRHLSEVGGTDRYDAVARSAFSMLQEFLHDGDILISDVGAWSGLGGIVYALGALGERWPDLPKTMLAERTVARVALLAATQRRCAVFDGLAGASASMVAYYVATGADSARSAAVACGERLLELAVDDDGVPRWANPDGSRLARASFAFGTVGIAWSLARLALVTGDERFGAAASAALRDDCSNTTSDAGIAAKEQDTWRYGAPGVALAMLELNRIEPSSWNAPLEDSAREIAARRLPFASHSLCNGALGSIDVLLQLRTALPAVSLQPSIDMHLRSALDSAARIGWQCGVPLNLETPGLMNGLAGIGYGFLRVVAPERVPSALNLESWREAPITRPASMVI